MTPKFLFRFSLSAILLLAFTSFLSADIIYVASPYGGIPDFSALGSQFTFPATGQLIMEKCPGDNGPITCYASFGSISVSGSSSVGEYGYSIPLTNGTGIGPNDPFLDRGLMVSVANLPFSPYEVDGLWGDSRENYLGFKVISSDGYHYGWADLEIDGFAPDPYTPDGTFYVKIWDYAYESCPDQSIIAGQTSGGASCGDPADPPDPTPAPGTAISLLIGLAGLTMYGFETSSINWNR